MMSLMEEQKLKKIIKQVKKVKRQMGEKTTFKAKLN